MSELETREERYVTADGRTLVPAVRFNPDHSVHVSTNDLKDAKDDLYTDIGYGVVDAAKKNEGKCEFALDDFEPKEEHVN